MNIGDESGVELASEVLDKLGDVALGVHMGPANPTNQCSSIAIKVEECRRDHADAMWTDVGDGGISRRETTDGIEVHIFKVRPKGRELVN